MSRITATMACWIWKICFSSNHLEANSSNKHCEWLTNAIKSSVTRRSRRNRRFDDANQRRTVLVKKRTVPYRYSKDHSFYRTVPYRTKKVAYRTVPLPPGVCGIPSREIPYRQLVQFFFRSFTLAFNKCRVTKAAVGCHRHMILAVSS